MKPNVILGVAALNGFAVTGLAAIGAHALSLSGKDADLFRQAIDFHYIHILALAGCAMLSHWGQSKWANRSAILFLVGIAGFSVSLYWRAIMGPGSLGSLHWLTPLGGLSLMAGWLLLAIGALTFKQD